MINFKLVYDEKTGTWGKKKEPYTTIEVETEKDFKHLVERLGKQIAEKPLGVDLHGKESGNIYKWVCPTCEKFLAGLKTANEKSTFLPDYCCVCGQKIDWSDIRNDKL